MTDRDMELNIKDVDGHGASIKKKTIYLHLMSSMCMGNRHKEKRGVLTLTLVHMQCVLFRRTRHAQLLV